ncbi:hypothetical protein OQA88_8225 [Cercophora sp. LCS_1]
MAIKTTPRSVSDATRFTAATPHASSRPAEPRFSGPSGTRPSKSGGGAILETPEERVARLRAAHQRAVQSRVSRFDKFVDGGRRFFDSAHKVAVMGLIGFTVIAGMATAFTAYDMLRYNKKRKAEFIEAQKKLEADSLEAARLAYMTGKATEEQIALVEEAMERENGATSGSVFSRIPSALSQPRPMDDGSHAVERVTEAAKWPSQQQKAQEGGEKQTGLWAWMTSSLKKEEEGEEIMSSQRRLGYESLSEEDDATGVRDSDLVRSIESKVRAKAQHAFEKERENERKGGPLDQVGLDQTKEQPKKKGWW